MSRSELAATQVHIRIGIQLRSCTWTGLDLGVGATAWQGYVCTNELLVSAYITCVLPLYRISVHTGRVMLQVSSVELFL